MATDFQSKILEAQVRECFGRVVYSHKTHEKSAEILQKKQSIIQVTQIVLSAITTVGLFAILLVDGKLVTILGAIASTILLAINTYTKKNDLSEQSQLHKKTANSLWYIREKYISLLTDLKIKEEPVKSLQNKRNALLEELNLIYSNAPNTNSNAYKKAQKALQVSEEMTFTEDEIDAFLPEVLKSKDLGGETDIPKYIKAE